MNKITKRDVKFIIVGIVLGLIFAGTGVYAAILYQSSDVSYDNSNSGLSSTNVQAALDELYNNHYLPLGPGDRFTLVPDSNSYTISTSLTGYSSNQTINPNELTLWRVIKKNSDGTIEAISEYVSSATVCFYGMTGYTKFVGTLQTIAEQYAKTGYTQSTRCSGYDGQTLVLSNPVSTENHPVTPTSGTGEEFDGGAGGDTLYLKDYLLINNIYETLNANKVGTNSITNYWLSSRYHTYYAGQSYLYSGRIWYYYNNSSFISNSTFNDWREKDGGNGETSGCSGFRPIITLKPNIRISSGGGTKTNPYILK